MREEMDRIREELALEEREEDERIKEKKEIERKLRERIELHHQHEEQLRLVSKTLQINMKKFIFLTICFLFMPISIAKTT
jgi:hypothetical protein